MTLQVKLIIAAILAALVGYSYYWTFSQGKVVGQNECVSKSVKALKDALIEQEREFTLQRQEEMREASNISKSLDRNQRQVVIQKEEIEKIIYVKDDIRNCVASTDLIRVLNASRGDSPSPKDGAVSGSNDAEVQTPS